MSTQLIRSRSGEVFLQHFPTLDELPAREFEVIRRAVEVTKHAMTNPWAVTLRRPGRFDQVFVGARKVGVTYVTNISGQTRLFGSVPPVGCKAGEGTIRDNWRAGPLRGRMMKHGEVAIFVGHLMRESEGRALDYLRGSAKMNYLKLEFYQNGEAWDWVAETGGWARRW